MITEYEISIQQENLFTDLFFFPLGKSYIAHSTQMRLTPQVLQKYCPFDM